MGMEQYVNVRGSKRQCIYHRSGICRGTQVQKVVKSGCLQGGKLFLSCWWKISIIPSQWKENITE